jgi:hypothetical protein
MVKTFLKQVKEQDTADSIAERTAAFLISKYDEILHLVGRAEQLAPAFQARSPESVLCHADIHAAMS